MAFRWRADDGSTSTSRGVPAYTQSTQLRTLIFECPKNTEVYRFCNNHEPDFDCFSLLFGKQLSRCLCLENAGEATI